MCGVTCDPKGLCGTGGDESQELVLEWRIPKAGDPSKSAACEDGFKLPAEPMVVVDCEFVASGSTTQFLLVAAGVTGLVCSVLLLLLCALMARSGWRWRMHLRLLTPSMRAMFVAPALFRPV